MPETADKIRRAGRKDSSLARTRPGSPKQTQAEHPKDTVATPRHFGQHAPKPREGRFRSSATCADAAQNTPRHRAREASKPAKHAPRVFANTHRSATEHAPTHPSQALSASNAERGSIPRPRKRNRILKAPQLCKMPRPPRPRQSMRPHTRHRLPKRHKPTATCRDAATSNGTTAARQDVVAHNALRPNSRQGPYARHHRRSPPNRCRDRPAMMPLSDAPRP